jgi:DNA-directed RNA polymerase specialized sigma24 family protein
LSELLKLVSEKHNDWIRIVRSFGEVDFHEDIVQEMYLKVHAHKDKDVWIRNDKLNVSYIYSILHNLFYDLQRSKSKVLKVGVEVLENFSDNDLNFDIEKNELNKIIDSEIMKLHNTKIQTNLCGNQMSVYMKKIECLEMIYTN